jgi:hypothetical protein
MRCNVWPHLIVPTKFFGKKYRKLPSSIGVTVVGLTSPSTTESGICAARHNRLSCPH